MEEKQSHPIPQDVTGFQFRLIGEMTVKQFVYLAGPSFLAWVIFQMAIPFFVKLPISIVLVGIGASLAFLPLAGRPMDVMIVNFIKALFKSTIYIYQKKGMRSWTPAISSLSTQKINIQKAGVQEPQIKKSSSESSISEMLQGAAQVLPTYSPPVPTPPPQEIPKHLVPQQDLRKAQVQQEKDGASEKKQPRSSAKEAVYLQSQLEKALAQKEELSRQLMELQQKLSAKEESFFRPTLAKAPADKTRPRMQTQNVRQVPKGLGKSVGLPTTPDSPNIITGIIKDPRENPLGNILVEIKDTESNPVRAFKTNGLGQFASATPLANGTYTISFEDPKGQNKFDSIEFSAKGELILPLEVMSIDTREELRKTLFKDN